MFEILVVASVDIVCFISEYRDNSKFALHDLRSFATGHVFALTDGESTSFQFLNDGKGIRLCLLGNVENYNYQ